MSSRCQRTRDRKFKKRITTFPCSPRFPALLPSVFSPPHLISSDLVPSNLISPHFIGQTRLLQQIIAAASCSSFRLYALYQTRRRQMPLCRGSFVITGPWMLIRTQHKMSARGSNIDSILDGYVIHIPIEKIQPSKI